MTRLLAAATAVVLLLAGCPRSTEEPPEAQDGSEARDGSEAVLESRSALGDPMQALGESVIALANGVDAARHKVPRGRKMRRQVGRLPELQAAVRDAADAAEAAAAEAPVEQAATIVEDAAGRARAAADAATGEIKFLRRLAEIDVALLAAARQWDRPGSQSEIRERLDNLAGRLGRLRGRLDKAKPAPRQCKVTKRNRAEWIKTVRQRTQTLQAQANSAGGGTFDQLRDSYRGLPFAEEPRTADRADRGCWNKRSRVARGADAMRTAVERLRAALS